MRKRVTFGLLCLVLFGFAPIASGSAIVNLDRVGSDRTNIVYLWDRVIASSQPAALRSDRHDQSIGAQDTQIGLPPISILFADSAIGRDPSLALDLTVPAPTPGVRSDLVRTRVNCDRCADVASGMGSDKDSGAGSAAIPEPATLGLLALALAGIGRHLRRTRT